MIFDWDKNKAAANFRKHGVSFEDALEIFDDPDAAVSLDEAHSAKELRFNIVGFCRKGLLFVVFTESENGAVRLISARRATKFEEKIYVGK